MPILTTTSTPTTPRRRLPARPLGASLRRVKPLLITTSKPAKPHVFYRCTHLVPVQKGPYLSSLHQHTQNHPHVDYRRIHRVSIQQEPMQIFISTSTFRTPHAIYRRIHLVPLHKASYHSSFHQHTQHPSTLSTGPTTWFLSRRAYTTHHSTSTPTTPHAVYRRTHLVPLEKAPIHSYLHQHTIITPTPSTGLSTWCLSRRGICQSSQPPQPVWCLPRGRAYHSSLSPAPTHRSHAVHRSTHLVPL